MVREGVLALRREQGGNWPQEAFVCAKLSPGAGSPDSVTSFSYGEWEFGGLLVLGFKPDCGPEQGPSDDVGHE